MEYLPLFWSMVLVAALLIAAMAAYPGRIPIANSLWSAAIDSTT
jgi:hypothetical protein